MGLWFYSVEVGNVAQLTEHLDWHATDAGSVPQGSNGFFCKSQLSVQTLLRVSVHPPVKHALTTVHTFKILQSMSEFS